jgi:hypothetical protein
MADGEKAAKALLDGGIEKQFQASNKPSNLTAEQWTSAHKQTTGTVYQTLGWTAMQRNEHVEAEKQFVASLKENPANAQVSYWLGREALNQGNADKNELALFSFARAAVLQGPGALTPDGKKQVDEYLTKVYAGYTGTEEGLDGLKQMAMNQALPPADLKIESAEVRKYKEDQERRKANPDLYKFVDLKTMLTGAEGDTMWAKLRGSLTPRFRLYVVSSDSARPTTIHLSSRRGGPVEVVLELANRLRAAPANGSLLQFEGVASSLNKNPFRLGLTEGNTF